MTSSFARAAVAFTMICAATYAQAEPRVALVIGQSAYRAVPPLPNPANDAKAMSQFLRDAGFEVETASDLSQNDLRSTVADFAGRIAAKGPDTVALMFYAGHGIQVDGENFLIPIDVDPKREADVPLQAVRLNDVLNTLTSVPSRMRILLLDACRNNPFPAVSASAGRGLAMVDAKTGSTGTFVSFSTSPGAEAEDGDGANSPYTTALLSASREPGLTIEDALKRVRLAVNRATSGRQVPWDSTSLTEDFRFFAVTNAAPAAPTSRLPAAAQSVEQWRMRLNGRSAQEAYDLVITNDSVEAYEAYVALFAAPPLGERVRILLERRREMVLWNATVLRNSAASYQAFLARFPASDLAATARKLDLRTRNLPVDALAALPVGLPTVAVASAPSCPCNTSPALQPPSGRQKAAPVRRASIPEIAPRPPRQRRPPPPDDDDVVILRRPPPLIYGPPGGFIGGGPGRPNFGDSPGRPMYGGRPLQR